MQVPEDSSATMPSNSAGVTTPRYTSWKRVACSVCHSCLWPQAGWAGMHCAWQVPPSINAPLCQPLAKDV